MLKIEKGEPWILWPNYICDGIIDYPAGRILDGDSNFTFELEFQVDTEIVEGKGTVFAKLPSYFGLDVTPNGFQLLIPEWDETSEEFKVITVDNLNKLDIYNKNTIKIEYIDSVLRIYLGGDEVFTNDYLYTGLPTDNNSHIIFGAGNFPKNGFNLNYITLKLFNLHIYKDTNLISHHKFDKFIHNKSYDYSETGNFIHKI